MVFGKESIPPMGILYQTHGLVRKRIWSRLSRCAHPTLDHKVRVGRGIPTEWLQDGMALRVENVPIANRKRFGYELRAFPTEWNWIS